MTYRLLKVIFEGFNYEWFWLSFTVLAPAFLYKMITWEMIMSSVPYKPDKTVPKIKYMLHSVEDFEKAVAAVVEKYTSIGSAAKEFHIPHKTWSDWINGMIFQRTPIILKFFIPNPIPSFKK